MPLGTRLATLKDSNNLIDYIHSHDGDPIKFLEKRIPYYIQNNFILVAESNDSQIIGRILFQAKENPLLGVGEIEGVSVREDFRGKGIGKEMLKNTITCAQEYFLNYGVQMRCLYLMTRSNNFPAQKLYEQFGFKKINSIGKIFLDNEPEELIMARFF